MHHSLFQVVFPAASPEASDSEVTFSALPEGQGRYTLVAEGSVRGHLVFAEVRGLEGADFLEVILTHSKSVSDRLHQEVLAGMPPDVAARIN